MTSSSEVPQNQERKRNPIHYAEVGQVLSFLTCPVLHNLVALKDGTEFTYAVGQKPDAKILVKNNTDKGLTVEFLNQPTLGDVLIPWSEADMIEVYIPVKE